ncbi:MAG: hypothetical protein HKL95_01120 [Phycisphaerae bacterium]|nr:hypothetical protein [Phycisphaerae bacterium]
MIVGIAALNTVLVGCSLANHPTGRSVEATKVAKTSRPAQARGGTGLLVVPGTNMGIGAHWGTLSVPAVAGRRPWPVMRAIYLTAPVRHNPVYMHDLDLGSKLYEQPASWHAVMASVLNIPWFYMNLAITPALMVVHPPLQVRKSPIRVREQVYNGKLPCGGPVVPKMVLGRIYWRYPRVQALTSVPTH